MMLPSLALFLGAVGAAVVAPRDPEITAAPELRKRLDISTYAWYSLYESSGTVEWDYLTYDADATTWVTTGNYYRRCLKSGILDCPMWTSCSSGYMVGSTTSSYCGIYISQCSYDVLYQSFGASSRRTRYWCDETSYTGDTLYATNPGTAIKATGNPIASPTPTQVSSIEASTPEPSSIVEPPTPITTPPGSTASNGLIGESQTPTAVPKSGGDGTKKAGIIAGATIGGIALLGAFVLAIIFILRRKPKQQPQHYAPQPPVNPSMGAMASLPEKQPMANAAVVPDPRASNYYTQASMSPPVSPAPQYPGPNYNELGPTGRYP